MHIRTVSRKQPAKAQNIESILDIILQIIDVLDRLQGFLGVDFVGKFRGAT